MLLLTIHRNRRSKLLWLAQDPLNNLLQRVPALVNSTKKMSRCDWSWRCQELLLRRKRPSVARTKNRKRSSRLKKKR